MVKLVPKLDVTLDSKCTVWMAIGMFRDEARRQGWPACEIEQIVCIAACGRDLMDGVDLLQQYMGSGEVQFNGFGGKWQLPVTSESTAAVTRLREERIIRQTQMTNELMHLDAEITRAMHGG